MTVRQLKILINHLDDDATVKIEVTDEEYIQHSADVLTYEVGDDYLLLQAEE